MNENILIYGGTGGIGSALARRLSATGKKVHLVARGTERLAALGEEIGASTTAGDVNDPELFDRAVDDAGGTIDGLVYAVGTINLGSIQRVEPDTLLEDYKINAVGAALAARSAIRPLKKSAASPSIVFISSVAAERGFPFHASIGMAKGAVSALTRSLAAELAPKIRVNAIAPSLVKTPLSEPLLANRQTAESIAKSHPLPRLGEPEEVASLAAYLLSAEAGWITGQIIGVDGGRSALAGRG